LPPQSTNLLPASTRADLLPGLHNFASLIRLHSEVALPLARRLRNTLRHGLDLSGSPSTDAPCARLLSSGSATLRRSPPPSASPNLIRMHWLKPPPSPRSLTNSPEEPETGVLLKPQPRLPCSEAPLVL
jgi:hypothetical protein